MKKIHLLTIVILVLTGCSDIFNNNSQLNNNHINNYSCNNIDNTGDSEVLQKNHLITGKNLINYDKAKQLHTLLYHTGTGQNSNYNDKCQYSIYSNNNIVRKENIFISKKAITNKLSAKEKLNESIRNFQIYAENKGIKPIGENKQAQFRVAPKTVAIGTKWNNLYVLNIENDTFKKVNATCIAVSNHAYFFLEDGLSKLTAEQINTIKNAFDKDYEIIHKYYGTETDTDNNGKVSFIISDFKDGVFGFFYSADKYSQSQLPSNIKSNESDILYVNHKFFSDDRWQKYATDVQATFIHEFQHMVLFDSRQRQNISPNVDVWINEGLSMLSEYYGNYGEPHKQYLNGFFNSNQGKSLITDDASQDYGLSYLFMRYLQIRFGDSIVKKIYSSNKSGIQMIEDVTGMNFDELFVDFTTMILVTGRGITEDKRYNIEEFNGVQGSYIYNRNGFNLSELIDEVNSANVLNSLFITDIGHSSEISPYGFRITKWKTDVDTLTITGDNVKGMYYAW